MTAVNLKYRKLNFAKAILISNFFVLSFESRKKHVGRYRNIRVNIIFPPTIPQHQKLPKITESVQGKFYNMIHLPVFTWSPRKTTKKGVRRSLIP